MIRFAAVRIASTLAVVALLPAALRPVGAQTMDASSPHEVPEAMGCWTLRVDSSARPDAAEVLGLPAQIRVDPGGNAVAVRDGTTRRGSWLVGSDGTMRMTLPLVSGGATTLELTRSDFEWVGSVRTMGETNVGRIRNPPRVTLFRTAGCPKG